MTTYYVEIYDADSDTTDNVRPFGNQADAERALAETCETHRDLDSRIVASVVLDGLRDWTDIPRDSEYPYSFRHESVFTRLLDALRSVDRSELQ